MYQTLAVAPMGLIIGAVAILVQGFLSASPRFIPAYALSVPNGTFLPDTNSILSVDRHFCSDVEKARFERFRKKRYEVSLERGIPAYAIFTDKELAILSRLKELSFEGVKSLKGISPAHLEDNLHCLIEEQADETGGAPDGTDSSS